MNQTAKDTWRTSSYSSVTGQCVETRITPHTVHVRDTKDRGQGTVTVHAQAWDAFLGTLHT